MSPEQARGREFDFRSDQFAFGLLLYEMAAGVRAFSRDTPAQTLSAIIEDDPAPLETLTPEFRSFFAGSSIVASQRTHGNGTLRPLI